MKEYISWIPYNIKNKYFYNKEEIVEVNFSNIHFQFKIIKDKDYKSAYEHIENIKAIDWKTACLGWVRKRDKTLINNADGGENL